VPQTEQAVRLSLPLPEHVYDMLSTWAGFELDATPEDVLAVLADELCRNEQLRAYVASLAAE
jgi:hypothetical protein